MRFYSVAHTPAGTPKERRYTNRMFQDFPNRGKAIDEVKRLIKEGAYDIFIDINNEDGDLVGYTGYNVLP